MSEAEDGSGYKEILLARLANLNRALVAVRAEMGTLYAPGSPEQLRFISEFNHELDVQVLQAMNLIDKKNPSSEELHRKGRISPGEYEALKRAVFTPPCHDASGHGRHGYRCGRGRDDSGRGRIR